MLRVFGALGKSSLFGTLARSGKPAEFGKLALITGRLTGFCGSRSFGKLLSTGKLLSIGRLFPAGRGVPAGKLGSEAMLGKLDSRLSGSDSSLGRGGSSLIFGMVESLPRTTGGWGH